MSSVGEDIVKLMALQNVLEVAKAAAQRLSDLAALNGNPKINMSDEEAKMHERTLSAMSAIADETVVALEKSMAKYYVHSKKVFVPSDE